MATIDARTEATRTSAWARGLALVPLAVGLVVLLGWVLHVEALKTIYPGWVTLKANTALCFLLGAIALSLRATPSSPAWRTLATACGALVAIVGLLTLVEYLASTNLGIDELLFREPHIGSGTSHPGRMAPNSALDFVLLGVALVLTRSEARRPRVVAQWLALLSLFVALLALVGYLFIAHLLVTVASRTRMAPLTIASFLALGGGVLMVTRDVGAAAAFRGPGLGGTFGRPLLLASTVAPIAIGGVVLLGQRLSLWDAAFQGAVVAVLSIVVLDVVIWRSARSLGRSDAERAEAFAQLRRLLHTHDDFLSVASHELKTPLTVLKLKIQSLLRVRAGLTAERVVVHLTDAQRQIDRVTALMEMMLDVPRIEGGNLDLDRQSCDLVATAAAVVARYGDDAVRAKTSIELQASGSLMGTFDRPRIEQVIGHLLRNAVTHCEGSAIFVEVAREEHDAVLRVRDGGAGIAIEDQQRIFGRFERASSARHFGGLGLGLWLSDAIVKAHRGSITVASHKGGGSTFVVRLPIDAPDA